MLLVAWTTEDFEENAFGKNWIDERKKNEIVQNENKMGILVDVVSSIGTQRNAFTIRFINSYHVFHLILFALFQLPYSSTRRHGINK